MVDNTPWLSSEPVIYDSTEPSTDNTPIIVSVSVVGAVLVLTAGCLVCYYRKPRPEEKKEVMEEMPAAMFQESDPKQSVLVESSSTDVITPPPPSLPATASTGIL